MLLIMCLVFLVLILLGTPLAISAGLSSMLAIVITGEIPPVIVLQRMTASLDSFPLMAVPLFILTGQLLNNGGITRRIIKFSHALVGHIRGGLSHVNVIASMIFAGISGSATADTAGIGSILIPAMIEEGYDEDWAVGITAASSCIGPIIPPSILMILYGSITQLSIGKLFLAGLLPGILVGISLLITGYYVAVKRGKEPDGKRLSLGQVWEGLKESWMPLLAPVIIIVGITFGVFTATEAGVIAALYATFVGFVYRELTVSSFLKTLYESAKSSAIVMFIICAAASFGAIMAIEQVPAYFTNFMLSISDNPKVIVGFIVILMFILGFFIDATTTIIIFVPVLFPLGEAVGFNPYHFATVIIVSDMIGSITPPVGVLLYIACSVSGVPIKRVLKHVWLYVFAMSIVALMVAYIPAISTTLPNLASKFF